MVCATRDHEAVPKGCNTADAPFVAVQGVKADSTVEVPHLKVSQGQEGGNQRRGPEFQSKEIWNMEKTILSPKL